MRWLIIDEISQVTAELLAQCEHNVQCMMQANGTYKNGPDGVHPWGGLNVLYVGFESCGERISMKTSVIDSYR